MTWATVPVNPNHLRPFVAPTLEVMAAAVVAIALPISKQTKRHQEEEEEKKEPAMVAVVPIAVPLWSRKRAKLMMRRRDATTCTFPATNTTAGLAWHTEAAATAAMVTSTAETAAALHKHHVRVAAL
jgi:small neutral amino acid transporter SnatA (MarC family)